MWVATIYNKVWIDSLPGRGVVFVGVGRDNNKVWLNSMIACT
jgi:phage terminase large subunit-like protein